MYVGAATYDNQIVSAPQIIGGSALFFANMFDLTPQEGVFFGEDEIKEKEQSVVIGSKVKQELFGDASALGERITIKDRKFRVAGVIAPAGQVAFANVDDMILIPYTTVQAYLLGEERFFEFIVRVDDPKNVSQSERDIIATLRDTHDLKQGDDNDFKVRTPAALVEQVSSILLTLTIFLVSVVGVALLVGGIGIMNIMLVSVTERTREIGLRKAVGATDFDIRLQFLLEALLLTLFGGLAGVLAGGLCSLIAGLLVRVFTSLDWVISFPLEGVILSFGFSALIGIGFGIYPANLAAKKSPMEALRYE
jgi:putative ABC transport system permease protein